MDERTKNALKVLGKNIRLAREEKNISLEELAKKTNIRKKYLEKIECGEAYGVGTLQFMQIAEAMNIKPHVLAEGM